MVGFYPLPSSFFILTSIMGMEKPLEFKPIELKDKPLFDSFFTRHHPSVSEMTFTNLFCWRHSRNHVFTVHNGHLLVTFSENGRRHFYQPTGPDPAESIAGILERFPESSFRRVEKGIAERLKSEFRVSDYRDMADYVYNVSDMRDLPGDKYSQKRNFVKRFSEYSPTTCSLDVSTARDFLGMQERWCGMRDCEADRSMSAENVAVKECLDNFKALGVHGICIKVKGRMEAYAIGEALNSSTYVEHFEKANTEFTGIYQYIFKEFARSIPEGFQFLNREQDLGVEGLRKAKLSYHPALMIEKCSVSR